LILNL